MLVGSLVKIVKCIGLYKRGICGHRDGVSGFFVVRGNWERGYSRSQAFLKEEKTNYIVDPWRGEEQITKKKGRIEGDTDSWVV